MKAVYAHLQCECDNVPSTEKNLLASIDKAHELYFQMLALAPELVRYAEERQEIGRNKMLPTAEELNPNRKFVENKAVARLAECEAINVFCSKHHLSWSGRNDLIKNIYTELCAQEFFRKYMASESRSFREDAQLVADIYQNILEENELLEEVLEEMSSLWADDLGQTLLMVIRTITSMRESHEQVKLLPKFKSEDDLDFAKKLLRASIVNFAANQELIDKYSSNWEIDRVAMMDSVILAVAIAEAETFASIPVKVTLNEYIDIAKYYSTPSSSVFINGVLDKITAQLTEEGRIVKSGKGLL